MKMSNAEPETTSTIKKRIEELKTQHLKDMESLYAYYAQVYRQEQEDLRCSYDDAVSRGLDDPALDVSHFLYWNIFISIIPPFIHRSFIKIVDFQ